MLSIAVVALWLYQGSDSEGVSFQRGQSDAWILHQEVAAVSSAPDAAPSCPNDADCMRQQQQMCLLELDD